MALFAVRGFDGTDIVEIEAAVGLTPGSGGFYRHFKNKTDVFHAAVDAEIERVETRRDVIVAPPIGPDPRAELHARIEQLLEVLWEMRDLMAIVAHDGAQFPELARRITSMLTDGGAALDAGHLADLVAQGSITSDSAEVKASIVTMAGVGFTLAGSLLGQPTPAVDRAAFGAGLADLVTGPPSA